MNAARFSRLAMLPVAALCAGLSGCGFHPLYGDARMLPEMASIYVDPIANSDGYELRNALIDLLRSDGTQGGKAYTLKINLNETNQGVALQNNTTITRYNDTLTATYVLTDAAGKEVTRGSQTSLSSYNVANSPYATVITRQDADQRAAEDIAERIQIDLGVFFRRAQKR